MVRVFPVRSVLKIFCSGLALCTMALPAFAQTTSVEVGIGGYGAVRFTDAASLTCDAASEGSVRYVDADNTIEFCDDTVWRVLSPGGGSTSIDSLTDAVYDITTDHNMRLGTNTAMFSGAERNLFVGEQSGTAGTSNAADNNIAIGYQSLDALTTGAQNLAVGVSALGLTTSGGSNTALGTNTMGSNTTGSDNVAIGQYFTMYDNTIGSQNIAIGNSSLITNKAGRYIVAIGHGAMSNAYNDASLFNSYNTAVGFEALKGSATPANNSGVYNTAIGGSALDGNVDGSGQVAVGYDSLGAVTTGGTQNIGLGYGAGNNITTGDQNIVIGYDIDAASATANQQLNIGNAIYGTGIHGGTTRIGIGTNAPEAAFEIQSTEGTDAVIALDADDGDDATDTWFLKILASGNGLSFVNDASELMNLNTAGGLQLDGHLYLTGGDIYWSNNTAGNIPIADGTKFSPTAVTGDISLSGAGVTAIGADKITEAMLKSVNGATDEYCLTYETTTGDFEWQTCGSGGSIDGLSDAKTDYTTDHNLWMGSTAGNGIAAGGQYNIAIGETAGDAISTGDGNTGIGYGAMGAVTTDGDNTALGAGAMSANVDNKTTAIGYGSLFSGNNGFENTGLGYLTMFSLAGTAHENTALGSYVLWQQTSGDYNTGVGAHAMYWMTGGSSNTAVGYAAMGAANTQNYNTAVGYTALGNNTDGSGSTAIGYRALTSLTTGGTSNIALGYNAGDAITTGDLNIMIGHDVDATAATANNQLNIGNAIYGTGIHGGTTLIGIGTATPEAAFEIQSTEGTDAVIALDADDGDDATDTWFLTVLASGNGLSFVNDTSELMNLNTAGGLQLDGHLYLTGGNIYWGLNTSGQIPIADGTKFSPTAVTGDISLSGAGVTAIGADKILESMLKSVNSATDEYCLTYETTTGDFEWQTCDGIVAGRSLTATGSTVDADPELYTDTKCIRFEAPTAADDFKTIWVTNTAATITGISCETDATNGVVFDLQVDDGSPAGVNGSDMTCTTSWAEDTTLAGDTTMGANERLDISLTSVANSPTWVSICWEYTKDD